MSEWELFWPLTVGSRVGINQCDGYAIERRVGGVEVDVTIQRIPTGRQLPRRASSWHRARPVTLLDALRNVTVAFFAPSQLGAVLEVNESGRCSPYGAWFVVEKPYHRQW